MNQLILAHKGIESKIEDIFKEESSLNDQIQSVLCKEYVPQLVKCYEVTEFCFRKAIEKKCTLSFTGYSNGAWLSEYSIYFCEKYIKPMYRCQLNVDFKAVLFESPVIMRDENQSISNIIISEIQFDVRNLNIVNYLVSPNLMNSNKENQKSKKFLEKIKKKFIPKTLCDKIEQYRFIYNEESFENEKPSNYCLMENWPLLKIDFDNDYK
ncbi:lipase family, partial [Brachionus plicatilis]